MNYKHVFFFSLIFFAFFSILFHTHIPVIWPDEVLFFNPSWELANNGTMRTSVLNGLIPGMDTHTLWMPPVFMGLLAFVFKIFPAELVTARLFSSFVSLFSIFLVYRICLRFQFSAKRIIVVLSLLATDFLFLKFSHTSRMESVCLFFALGAFYFLVRAGVGSDDSRDMRRDLINQVPTHVPALDIFLSGICLSLSFLSHPFGIVHSIPILFLLFQRRSLTFKNLFLYCLAGLIPILIWGFYVFPNWELFVVQFGAQLSRKNELLGKFSWVDKFKIIFSVYKFPTIKLVLFVFTIGLVGYNVFISFRIQGEDNKSLPLFKKIKTSKEYFFFVWLVTIFIFLLLSSESWYVFHLVVPFTLLLSALVEKETFLFKSFLAFSLFYNLIVLVWVPISLYFIYKTPDKTAEFFYLIEKEVERKNNIYLQVFPDPYFYLRKKFPDKTLHEFIPGELSAIQKKNPDGSEKIGLLKRLGISKENYKIDASFYKETVHKQDVFLFYNENLMNDYIREYLSQNQSLFERKLILVDTPKGSDLKLEVVLYLKK